MEFWKTHPEYNNYEVSILGNIRKINWSRPVTLYEEKTESTGLSYYIISIQYAPLKSTRRFLHKLIAETFIPNTNHLSAVFHKNGNTLDNSVENLEWCTRSKLLLHTGKLRKNNFDIETLNTENEKWKIHPEFTDYAISTKGNIYNIKRKVYFATNIDIYKKKGQYVSTHLRKDGKRYFKLVNRLVAETFLPNPENKPTVNHIGDKYDNSIENLEWATVAEQMNHEIKNKKRVGCGGKHEYLSSEAIDGEIWKPIIANDTNTGYCISSKGRVKNKKGKIMKGTEIYHGRLVTICSKPVFAHKLVAIAFIPNPENLSYVCHIDNDPTNNDITNLIWMTSVQSMNREIVKKKLCKPVIKLSPEGIELERYKSITDARKNNPGCPCIIKVCKGKLKSSGGYGWKYEKE